MLNRLMGLDMEYGCMGDKKIRPLEAAQQLLDAVGQVGEFLPNGGRFYLDMGHPEMATPECSCPFEAIRYHLGADLLIRQLCIANRREGRIIKVYRDCIDSNGISYGCHENYLTLRRVVWERQLAPTIIPFLVSRIIFTGAGYLDETMGYCLSPRATVVDQVQGTSALFRSRSILNQRDECLIIGPLRDKYRRLHLTIGDANVADWTNLLKIGVTCLILSMIEAGINLADYYPESPVDAIKAINSDLTLRQKVIVRNKLALTALDIQHYFCDQAAYFFRAIGRNQLVPAWMNEIWQRWALTLQELDRYRPLDEPSPILWSIDWIAKWQLLKLWRRFNPKASVTYLQSIMMDYHALDQGGLAEYFANILESQFSHQALESATQEPPKFIRAQERGAAVRRLEPGKGYVDWTGQWNHRHYQPFNFPDIFET